LPSDNSSSADPTKAAVNASGDPSDDPSNDPPDDDPSDDSPNDDESLSKEPSEEASKEPSCNDEEEPSKDPSKEASKEPSNSSSVVVMIALHPIPHLIHPMKNRLENQSLFPGIICQEPLRFKKPWHLASAITSRNHLALPTATNLTHQEWLIILALKNICSIHPMIHLHHFHHHPSSHHHHHPSDLPANKRRQWQRRAMIH
jgi:hypothetical protein